MESKETTVQPAIHSIYAADEVMAELVEMFVDELPDRVATLRDAFEARDFVLLNRIAHQLKGAFGSYGFDAITEPARNLEISSKAATSDLQWIEQDMLTLISFCQRTSASASPNP